MWAEVRCAACIAAGRYSRILCTFRIGSLTPAGEIAVKCKSCGCLVRVTADNQYGDGIQTFRRIASTTEDAIVCAH
jgi:hypothetical protein